MLTDFGKAARCNFQEAGPSRHQGDQGLRREGYGTTTLPVANIPVHEFLSMHFCDLRMNPSTQRAIPELDTNLTNSQGTSDVRLDPQLNKKVWEQGIKGVPYRLRIRISRRRNDEEDAKEKLYSYVQAVNVKNPKGLVTVVVEE